MSRGCFRNDYSKLRLNLRLEGRILVIMELEISICWGDNLERESEFSYITR